MPNASQLRDSTQIILAQEVLDALEPQLVDEFTVTVVPNGEDQYRVIGSPVEIEAASEFLSRHGVNVR